jgi:NAD(P)-dependent dehydrogenase (short-subunit alcohol dehydrogenase family)
MASGSENKIYVVTGGNRGLGLALIKTLLARPCTTVIATVRNEQSSAALEAEAANIPKGNKSSLQITQIDFSADVVPEKVREAFTVDHVDVLICNAGAAPPLTTTDLVSAADLRVAFEVNTIAPLMVFQALWPLLQKSASAPKVIMITSTLGSIEAMEPLPAGAYGPSKAALNWIAKSLHKENEASGIVAFALHPGWVKTSMGDTAAEQWGIATGPPLTIETSVQGMIKVIDGATRDTLSGKLVSYDGQVVPW